MTYFLRASVPARKAIALACLGIILVAFCLREGIAVIKNDLEEGP